MGSRARILIVDDNRANIRILARSLQKAGYDTLDADDGFKAVEIATSQMPDIILLDVIMPERDGLEVCRLLKSQESTASIPIIFVTAASESRDIVNAFSVGGCDYITKPLKTKEVLARVSVQLRLRQAEMDLVERNEELAWVSENLARANTELAKQARIDSLTGLLNRGAWDEAAELEHERSLRHDHVYGIIMIDIDHFKSYNDTLGHPAGDECLCRAAQCLKTTSRALDLVGRYGGEEFVILVPETQPEDAYVLAERLRQATWDLAMNHPVSPAGRVTVSVGVASCDHDSLEATLILADKALYRAKSSGRNLVCAEAGAGPFGTGREAQSAIEVGAAVAIAESVLLVDDNAANRAVYRRCLEREGYLVREASNGETAISEVGDDPPDVIVMDVMMPGMDGLACTRELKLNADTRDIPVIMVSANSATADIVAGLEAGADEYIAKPIRNSELVLRVGSMVRLQRERKDLLRSYQLRAEQIRMLVLLLDLCRSVGSASNVDDLLTDTMAAVAEVSGCRRISIMLPDRERRYLYIATSTGIDPDVAASVKVSIGEGLAGEVFKTGQAVVLNTASENDRRSEGYDSPFFASLPLLCAPLGSAGETVGVVNIAERVAGQPFESRDLEYIELITNIVGHALGTILNRQSHSDARDLTLVALARLAEHRDNETARHVDRVARYSVLLANELRNQGNFLDEIDDEFIRRLGFSVPLHDIGKVAIPDAILRKPGRLTVEEMGIMRTHSDIGAETLRRVCKQAPEARFLNTAIDIIQSHHEWYDGSGYPQVIKGETIPLSARIAAVADVYDAITTKRVYKNAISHTEAVKVIVDAAGSQFDPAVVQAFVACEQEFATLADDFGEHSPTTQDRSSTTPIEVGITGGA